MTQDYLEHDNLAKSEIFHHLSEAKSLLDDVKHLET